MSNVYTRYYMERERRKRRNRQIVSCIFWLFMFAMIMGLAGEEDRKAAVVDTATNAEIKTMMIQRTVEMGAR